MKSRWVVGLTVVVVIGVAIAAHYGRFICSDCTLEGDTPDPTTATFIVSTVNQSVNQWRAKDTVTICNAATCSTYQMISVMGGIPGMKQVSRHPRGSGGGGESGGEGGSGGGSGGSWSGVGGGGCEGDCEGKVIVGTEKPIRP